MKGLGSILVLALVSRGVVESKGSLGTSNPDEQLELPGSLKPAFKNPHPPEVIYKTALHAKVVGRRQGLLGKKVEENLSSFKRTAYNRTTDIYESTLLESGRIIHPVELGSTFDYNPDRLNVYWTRACQCPWTSLLSKNVSKGQANCEPCHLCVNSNSVTVTSSVCQRVSRLI